MNRRSFLAGLFAVAASTQVKAEDLRSLCNVAIQTANSRLVYKSDREAFGRIQHVDSPAQAYAHGFGDCEEFALCYRSELIKLGVSPDRIKIIYCMSLHTPNVGHAACVVDRGAYVLDCTCPRAAALADRLDLVPHPKYNQFIAMSSETESDLVQEIQDGYFSMTAHPL